MNPKKMLAKELAAKVKGQISEETVSEMVEHFFRHGNTFLLLELLNLRKEVESLREELQQSDNKQKTLSKLLIR
ncbi:MAG TPA: hypothetical protein VLM82_00830 [Acidobacteriota bacterium]|nr:hypothetical protein [Acidobacteriota bacterium]